MYPFKSKPCASDDANTSQTLRCQHKADICVEDWWKSNVRRAKALQQRSKDHRNIRGLVPLRCKGGLFRNYWREVKVQSGVTRNMTADGMAVNAATPFFKCHKRYRVRDIGFINSCRLCVRLRVLRHHIECRLQALLIDGALRLNLLRHPLTKPSSVFMLALPTLLMWSDLDDYTFIREVCKQP